MKLGSGSGVGDGGIGVGVPMMQFSSPAYTTPPPPLPPTNASVAIMSPATSMAPPSSLNFVGITGILLLGFLGGVALMAAMSLSVTDPRINEVMETPRNISHPRNARALL
jgi:hypothetical protein